jgi:hypothetical protein
MGLDYDGKPKFVRERDLFIRNAMRNSTDNVDSTFPSDKQPAEDQLFDDLAKTFLKGEALKEGLAGLAPAGFIPVEDEAKVRAAIVRVAPDIKGGKIITFGLFKEACEYLAGAMMNVNEDFITGFKHVDPEVGARKFTQQFKGQQSYSDDWLSAFLDGLLAVGGLWLASYMLDMQEAQKPTTGVDSQGASGEVQSKAMMGMPAGMCFLIELGMTLAAFLLIYGQANDPSAKDKFKELEADPAKRKKILEDAGFDYEKFKRNQQWNDYKAIKDYAVKYISMNPDKLNYDHWVGWLNVLESQTVLTGAIGMAPTFSNKWRKFYTRGDLDTDVKYEEGFTIDDLESDPLAGTTFDVNTGAPDDLIKDTLETAMSDAIKGYFSGLLTATNKEYDTMLASYSFYVDERLLCCILWFVGPVDTGTLRTLSAVLKIALFDITFSLHDLIASIIDTCYSAVINLLNNYIHELVNGIITKIYKLLAKIPEAEFGAFLTYCIGIEWLLLIIDYIMSMIVDIVDDCVKFLTSLSLGAANRGTSHAIISAERRCIMTMAAFLESIADQFDRAQSICPSNPDQDPDSTVDYDSVNELAADQAIKFVAEVLPDMFPVLEMPEEVRRKHFRNVPSFVTPNIGIEISGFDSTGRISPKGSATTDCAQNTPALKGVAMAEQLAKLMRREN